LGNEAEKRRRVLEAVVSISMDSLRPPEDFSDAQAAADWEDIGGPSGDLTPEEVEHMAITMFGCPAPDEIDDE
tara:strand:- start:2644 stop:2862 length:219 start_codon:yes stop_codon:yes gene_type:complete